MIHKSQPWEFFHLGVKTSEIENMVEKEWVDISQEVILCLVDNVPHHVKAVLKAKYWLAKA